jgi:hypothetical protein
VSGIEADASGGVSALVSRDAATGEEERHEADAVVFAISISGGRSAVGLGAGVGWAGGRDGGQMDKCV